MVFAPPSLPAPQPFQSLTEGLHFRRQQVIAGFIVDFYCHAARLVVEVDGPVHDTRHQEDFERDRILGEHGLTVIRFSNTEIEAGLAEVLKQILRMAKPQNL
jgi:very-short-patch-repair endonuclease